jgi:hypothetical protein
MLEGINFILFTDHKPLTFAFKQSLDKATPLQIRYLDYISQFTTEVRHISGKDNVVADMLSRIEEVGLPSPIDFQELAEAQENDDELKQILKNNTALNLRKIQLPNCSYEVYCDDSNNKIRPYVPPQLRAKVFRQFHNVSHPGIRASKNLVNKHFFLAENEYRFAQFRQILH